VLGSPNKGLHTPNQRNYFAIISVVVITIHQRYRRTTDRQTTYHISTALRTYVLRAVENLLQSICAIS